MTKTKTKRTIWTVSIILVALLIGATIFYFFYLSQKSNEEENSIKEVQVKETIKASEIGEDGDQKDQEGVIESREFVSEYYNEGEFNAVGGSWEELNAPEDEISIFVRVKNKGIESEWYPFYKERIKSEKGINYYHAESPILIRGDSYQYKIIFDNKNGEVRNLEITIINTMGNTSSRLFDKITSLFLNNQAGAAFWNPANIISRSEWGGSAVNESATLWPPQYADKSTKFVVHHTAGENKSCPDLEVSKQDMRAIWNYHTYYNKWGDIGYNYVLDHCGRVFEGRLGGNNVIAGHASPYNFWDKIAGDGKIDEASIGISVLGDYSNLKPDAKVFEGLGRIIGYKSYINGIDPYGLSYFKNKTTYDIAGHRDYTSTACPGSELYSRLSSVRYAADAYKNQYLDEFEDYEFISQNIVLWSARVSMQDVSNPDGFVLAKDPAIGEPITMLSSIKNNNSFQVNLKNVKVVGILDNGTEFVIGQTPSLPIDPNTVAKVPSVSYNISSFRYQTYKITYELQLEGPSGSLLTIEKEPTISTSYRYPSIVPHFPIVRTTSSVVVNPQSLKEGESLSLSANIKNLDLRPAYLYSFGPIVNVGSFSKNNHIIMPGDTATYMETRPSSNPGSYEVEFSFRYGNGTTTKLIPSTTSVVTKKSLYISPENINYANISLNSFRVETEDKKLVSTSFSPAIGEPLEISASLRNSNPYPVSISDIRLVGVLDNGTGFVIGSQSTMNLPANSTTQVVADKNSYNITSVRSTTFYLDFVAESQRKTPTISSTYVYQSFTPHFPIVRLASGPSSNPSTPVAGSSSTLSFEFKNNDTRPAYLRNVHLKVDDGQSVNELKSVPIIKINPGSLYKYSDTKIFTSVGEVSLSAHYSFFNSAAVIQASDQYNQLVISSVTVVSEPVDYKKISLNSFRVSMEDTSVSGGFILASSPAIGEPVTVLAGLRNSNSDSVTLNNIRIRGVLDSGVEFTVGTMASLTIPAGAVAAVDPKSFNITSFKTHSFYLDFEVGGKRMSPYVKPTYTYQQIKAHFPDVRIVKTPKIITPATPVVMSPVTANYELRNYDVRPAYIRHVTVLSKLNNKIPYYFPKQTTKINPGTKYTYERAIIPANGGIYYSNAEITYGNGTVAIPKAISGVSSYVNFRVYTEVATLDGVSMPATSGKVAVEQHLVTNSLTSTQISNIDTAFRSCVTTQNEVYPYPYCANPNNLSAVSPISESNHYSATGVTLSSLKNRMAWMTTAKIRQTAGQTSGWISAGGLYGAWGIAPSTFNEKYYINMRWNYTDLHGQPIYTNKSWYYGKRVIVTNPANGKKVVTTVIEYGPSIMTRVAGLSPEAMYAIGAVTDNTLNYYWAADQSMPLGPIN